MKITFFIIIFSITLLMVFYVTIRGYQTLNGFPALRLSYLTINIVLFCILLSNFLLRNTFPDPIAKTLTFVGYSYMLVMIYLLFSFLLIDIIRLANHFLHFAPAGMTSFRLWAMGISVGIISTAMIYGNYKFTHPEIVKLQLKARNISQNKTIRIVAASDIHLGVSIDKKYLQKYVTLINAQKPDIVLLAGDIADHSTIPVINQNMADEFRQIKTKYGVYAISGNHEYFGEDPYALEKYLSNYGGIKYLRDNMLEIDKGLYLIGRDDRINSRRKQLPEIIQHIDLNTNASILLDHQPFDLHQAEGNHIDLQISGHTHQGQFFPGNLIVKKMYENAYGYYKKGNTHTYVSSGLGIWGPQYRIGSQSEIVVIDFEY